MELSRTEILIDPELNELVPGFCEARKKDLQDIGQFLSTNDFVSVAKICHTVKGVARPYGFPTLETLSRQLEAAAKSNNSVLSLQLLKEMKSYMENYT